MIYFKSFIYRLLIVFIVGAILIFVFRAILGQLNSLSMLAIVLVALALSPRFEVVDTKSGQKLQMSGFPVTLIRSIKKLLNKKEQ